MLGKRCAQELDSDLDIPDHDFAIYPDWLRRTTAGTVDAAVEIKRKLRQGDQILTEDPVGWLGYDSCFPVVDDDDDI